MNSGRKPNIVTVLSTTREERMAKRKAKSEAMSKIPAVKAWEEWVKTKDHFESGDVPPGFKPLDETD